MFSDLGLTFSMSFSIMMSLHKLNWKSHPFLEDHQVMRPYESDDLYLYKQIML